MKGVAVICLLFAPPTTAGVDAHAARACVCVCGGGGGGGGWVWGGGGGGGGGGDIWLHGAQDACAHM